VRITTSNNGFCFAAEIAIRDENLAVRIESEEVLTRADHSNGWRHHVAAPFSIREKELRFYIQYIFPNPDPGNIGSPVSPFELMTALPVGLISPSSVTKGAIPVVPYWP
jgi:hypothetical protein